MADYHDYKSIKVETAGPWNNDYKPYVQPSTYKEGLVPNYKPSKPVKVKGNVLKDDKLKEALNKDLSTRGLQQTNLNEQ